MNATVLKTIVSSGMGRDIAAAYDLETIDTLTGFKYISEWVKELEEIGGRCFLFGYEESYGYLIGEIGRDKDVVQAYSVFLDDYYYFSEEIRSKTGSIYFWIKEVGTNGIPTEITSNEFYTNLSKTYLEAINKLEDELKSIIG